MPVISDSSASVRSCSARSAASRFPRVAIPATYVADSVLSTALSGHGLRSGDHRWGSGRPEHLPALGADPAAIVVVAAAQGAQAAGMINMELLGLRPAG